MKLAWFPLPESAMKLVPFALSLFVLAAAPMAQANQGDAFFCYWVDAAHKQVATTDIFPGDRKDEKDISAVFAMDMQKASGKGKARMYDCAWRAGPREAADALDNLRATQASNGFRVDTIDWSPMNR
jgi:hypothetical protein